MKKNYAILICGLLIMYSLPTWAQKSYFEKQVKYLTSEKLYGRGYTHQGMENASQHIAKELKRMGVKPVQEKFFQRHNFPINVIHSASLEINGQRLKYGKDFIVKPSSKSIRYTAGIQNYIFDTNAYISSFQSKEETIKFIREDEEKQKGKHIIMPPLQSSVDSIKNYYKQWANTYEINDNTNRAIFRFVSDSLTSSLSQRQANVTEFIIKDHYYRNDLSITNFHVDATFNPQFEFNNIIGLIEGKYKDSILVISAHYDHLGSVNDIYFPGASDNASGTAMALDLARYYSKNNPNYSIVFMFFGAEEAGIVGALKYVEQPLFPLEKIKFLVNLDIMGAGEDGIQVVNGSKYSKQFDQLVKINQDKNYLKQVKVRGESCNSDHCPFDHKGVPSFFIYTLGGKGNYHNIYDTYENLDLSYAPKVKGLLIDFINQL